MKFPSFFYLSSRCPIAPAKSQITLSFLFPVYTATLQPCVKDVAVVINAKLILACGSSFPVWFVTIARTRARTLLPSRGWSDN
uniref:Uncharacterized protein n=1 Tax=viral metagenome TaxID=1070528 RepID=A0A6C0ELI4_9ZZZZ